MDTEASSAKAVPGVVAYRERLLGGIERALLLKWEDLPREWGTRLAVFLAVWAGVVLTNGLHYPWLTSAFDDTPILALTDPSVYKRDFYIQEMLQFTPRFYYQRLVAAATTAFDSLVTAQAFIGFLTIGVAVIALLSLGRALRIGVAASGALAFLLLTVVTGCLGYYQLLYPVTPTPATLASATMLCGLPFLVQRRWNWAFLFFGLSCLLQVIVGLFAMATAAPALLLDARRRGWTSLLVPLAFGAAGVGAVLGPIWLSKTSGSALISAEDFIRVYAHIGFPWHLLPSTWPADEWIAALLFYAGGLTLLHMSEALSRHWLIAVHLAVAVAAAGIAFNALGTMWIPIPAAAKLCFARATPFAQTAVLIGLGVALGAEIRARRYVAAAVLAAGMSVPMAGAALLVISVYWQRLHVMRGLRGYGRHFAALLVGLFATSSLASIEQFSSIVRHAGRESGLLLALIFPALIFAIPSPQRRLWIAGTVAASLWLSMGAAVARVYPRPLQSVFDRQIYLDEARIPGPYDLARLVRRRTAEDALFLVPPDFILFRLLSRRAVVVDVGTFPYTDAGILEWERRMEALVGRQLEGTLMDRTLVEQWYRERPLAELKAVARDFQADYIVTNVGWHHPAPHEIAFRDGPWVCIATGRDHGARVAGPVAAVPAR